MHYRNDLLIHLRDEVFIRYSLFDLTKIYVYSKKGEFLCVANQVQKVHPITNEIDKLDEYTLKGILNARESFKTVQKIEKLYA